MEIGEVVRYLRQLAEGEPVVILEDIPRSSSQTEATPPARDEESRVNRLEMVRTQALGCTACRLSDGRRNVVFGVGNIFARLMFVGEGPGADEDRQGEPFVGRAGQLLDRIIAAMGLRRKDVYIANIVKCRPPGNRVPAVDEAHQCLPFLRSQIEIIQPEVIVALGSTAAQYLLDLPPNAAIKSLRGRIHKYQLIPVVITYHPAALLRSASYKAPTWEDMQMVMRLLAER